MNLEKLKSEFKNQFPNSDFEKAFENYQNLKCFSGSGNVFDDTTSNFGSFGNEEHMIMKYHVAHYFKKAFEAMKIDMSDPNLSDVNSKGTAMRLATVYCGENIEDDSELGCGRLTKKPHIQVFPNQNNLHYPITKRVELVSNCSHHTLPFGTFNGGSCIISYIPEKYVLGISKIQRLVDWIARRYWLQEDLTSEIHRQISEVTKSKSVYVELTNITHTCEKLRGVRSDGSFSSILYSGLFEKPEYRDLIK